MEADLERVLQVVIPYLQDPNERVRHGACNAIGQMSTDFADDIQIKFHQLIVPALVRTMVCVLGLILSRLLAASVQRVQVAYGPRASCGQWCVCWPVIFGVADNMSAQQRLPLSERQPVPICCDFQDCFCGWLAELCRRAT